MRHAQHNPAKDGDALQALLFGEVTPPTPKPPRAGRHEQLARQLPAGLRLGTSSWSFPGWEGIVYAGSRKAGKRLSPTVLSQDGLGEYASSPLLQTVGLDRTFYQPIAEREFARYASQVPSTFRFLVKAHGQLFRPPGLGRVGDDYASAAPAREVYLDSAWMLDAVIAPAVQGLSERGHTKLGVVLMQLPPLPLKERGPAGTPAECAAQLVSFLRRVRAGAPGVPLALEVRNSTLVRPELVQAMRELGISPGLVHHPALPRVARQVAAWGEAMHASGPWVCRWMLHHSQSYEGAKGIYEPFDKIVDDDAPTRAEIAEAGCAALRSGREGLVIINNKAEGSAPLSVEMLAEQFARVFAAPQR